MTVDLNIDIYRTLRIKAELSSRTLSDLANDAVALSLSEDAMDSEAIRKRAHEPSRPFSSVLRNLKRRRTRR